TSTRAFQRSSPGGGQDCFVTKFDDTAKRLTYSTYFGGSSADTCTGFAVDRQGFVYLAGITKSPNIPLNQPSFGGTIPTPPVLRFNAGFLTRLTADASDINYSVLLGSSTADTEIDGLALDALGRVHLTGFTRATDFPMTANALAATVPQQGKTFVSVVDPNFNKLVYSTVLPGSGSDTGWKIQPDVFGNPWITGNAFTGQFPVTADALSHTGSANPTPYAAQIDITASKLVHATYLAGNAGGTASAIAVATDGTVYVAGGTLSTDFPVQSGPFQSAKTSDYAIYLQRLDFSQTPPPTGNTPVVTTVVNGASFVRGISPGAAIAIFGTNLATTTAQFSGKPPTTLGGTSVSIDGKNIPLFYVSPTQINAQMPYEIGPSTPVLRVTVNGVSSAPGELTEDVAAPGIFIALGNRAAVTNADSTLNTQTNPAATGSAITIYFTGIGPLDNPVPTGAPAPLDGPLSRATLPVTVTIGGQKATVAYAGLTPGSISLAQANVVVPDLPPGDYPVIITVGTFASNGPLISVAAR
ncbi:MAG TPA: SBBP repeat-containing protein, partial [Candidatus Solibacter sp.]|nr:SBBP repeat-containing protein [Candidatus Solibacter sp.]